MRITKNQHQTILKVVQQVLSQEASVILFGSRVDDDAKGGDIDILIETKNKLLNPADIKATIGAKLLIAFQGKKVDILLSAPNLQHFPIHDIAKKNGIIL